MLSSWAFVLSTSPLLPFFDMADDVVVPKW